MVRLLIIVLSCLPLLLSAGEFYKWVDKKGVTHYDEKKPDHEAEIITTIDVPPVASPRPYPPLHSDDDNSDVADSEAAGYSQFAFAKPEPDETIHSNEGLVNVSFFLSPGLRDGDKIVITFDGQKLGDALTTTQLSLTEIPRGTHTLKADIVNAEGETVASASAVSFHLRQHSIIKPR